MAFLAGQDAVDPAVEEIGGLLGYPSEPRWDAAQLQALERIRQGLLSREPVLIAHLSACG